MTVLNGFRVGPGGSKTPYTVGWVVLDGVKVPIGGYFQGAPVTNPGPVISLAMRPFDPLSVVNYPLCDGITYADPATDLATQSYRAPTGNLNTTVRWGMSFVYSTNDHPLEPITDVGNTKSFGSIRVNPNAILPDPPPGEERDGWCCFMEPDGTSSIDVYKGLFVLGGVSKTTAAGGVDRVTTSLTSEGPGRIDFYGDGLATVNGPDANLGQAAGTRGKRASGIPIITFSLRKWELQGAAGDKRVIKHALCVALPGTSLYTTGANKDTDGWAATGLVWPARYQDGDYLTGRTSDGSGYGKYTGNFPMGGRVALPWPGDNDPDKYINSLGLSTPEGIAVAYALLYYGAFVTDRASSAILHHEAPNTNDPDGATYKTRLDALKPDWQILHKKLVRVTGHSAALPGGPGTPRTAINKPSVLVPISA